MDRQQGAITLLDHWNNMRGSMVVCPPQSIFCLGREGLVCVFLVFCLFEAEFSFVDKGLLAVTLIRSPILLPPLNL